jgi:hypothetical protein
MLVYSLLCLHLGRKSRSVGMRWLDAVVLRSVVVAPVWIGLRAVGRGSVSQFDGE